MHRMHPALAVDTDGHRAVVWHIAEADNIGMLCGVRAPATTAAQWLEFPELDCPSCRHAYRRLLGARQPGGEPRPDGTHLAG